MKAQLYDTIQTLVDINADFDRRDFSTICYN